MNCLPIVLILSTIILFSLYVWNKKRIERIDGFFKNIEKNPTFVRTIKSGMILDVDNSLIKYYGSKLLKDDSVDLSVKKLMEGV